MAILSPGRCGEPEAFLRIVSGKQKGSGPLEGEKRAQL